MMTIPEIIIEHKSLSFFYFNHSTAAPNNSNSPVASGPLYEEVKLQEIEMTKMNDNVAYGVN